MLAFLIFLISLMGREATANLLYKMTVTILVYFIFMKTNLRHYDILSLHASLTSLDIPYTPKCYSKSKTISVITLTKRYPYCCYHTYQSYPQFPCICRLFLSWTNPPDSMFINLTLQTLVPHPTPSLSRTDHLEKYCLGTLSFKRRVSHVTRTLSWPFLS